MRVAFCTAAFPQLPLAEVSRLALGAGYIGLDINADLFERGPKPHLKAPFDTAAYIAAGEALHGLSLASCALSANIYLVVEDTVQAEAAKGHVKSVIDLAQALRVPFVHVFTGRAPAGMTLTVAKRQLADALAELCEYAAARDVVLGIEGCAVHFVRSMADYLELFGMIPGSDLRLCWDPSHLFLHGEPVLEATDRLFDRICMVHVKDAMGRLPDFSLPPLGLGQMPWTDLLDLLAMRGYAGVYAVEYEAAQFGFSVGEHGILEHARTFLRQHGI